MHECLRLSHKAALQTKAGADEAAMREALQVARNHRDRWSEGYLGNILQWLLELPQPSQKAQPKQFLAGPTPGDKPSSSTLPPPLLPSTPTLVLSAPMDSTADPLRSNLIMSQGKRLYPNSADAFFPTYPVRPLTTSRSLSFLTVNPVYFHCKAPIASHWHQNTPLFFELPLHRGGPSQVRSLFISPPHNW